MIRAVMTGSTAPRRAGKRTERGASAVEFALVLPVLLLIVFGIIAYGIVFAAQISINSAARDASRAGVTQPVNGAGLTCLAIAQRARNASTSVGVDSSASTVTVSSPTATGAPSCTLAGANSTGSTTTKMCTGSTAGGQLVVKVTLRPKVPVPMVPLPSSISGTGSFQCEYS